VIGIKEEKEGEGGSTLTFALRIHCIRVPEIEYTIYLILKRSVSRGLWIASNPSHTTIWVSSAIFASYMGSFISGLVSDLPSEK